MVPSILLPLLLLVPLASAAIIFATPALRGHSLRVTEAVHVAAIALILVLALATVAAVLNGEPLAALGNWLYVDPLAAIFVMLIGAVGFLTGLYSISYMRHELAAGEVSESAFRVYYGFFNLFLFTMLLTVTANNIIMMWVAIEATTLGSAFLVGLYGRRSSLEATWKYVVICTVGVAFGLYGTVLAYANAASVIEPGSAILWTTLAAHASEFDAGTMQLAFVFILVGFGTKAGIFPMHAWLPDAHSEAPSPVSGLLSGVLLKCALFVIIRYYVLVTTPAGAGFAQTALLVLGTLSICVASVLFFVQQDVKRKLAYSSVENVGLIVLGLGIGGPLGVAAALLHTINHSFAKALLFCSSGNMIMKYGTRDLRETKGLLRTAPMTGLMLICGALALGGLPPFNIFVSKFLLVVAGLDAGYGWLMVACLLLFTISLAGLLRIVSGSVLGPKPEAISVGDAGWLSLGPVAGLLAVVLVMGIAVPGPVARLVENATAVVTGAPGTIAAARAPWQKPDDQATALMRSARSD